MNPMYWRFRHKVERMKLSALVWCELHPSPSSPNSTSYYNETLHVCGYYSNIVLYLWKVIWQFFFKFSFSNLYNKDILLMEKKSCSLRTLMVFWISGAKLLKSWVNFPFARSVRFLPSSSTYKLSCCLFIQEANKMLKNRSCMRKKN